MLLTYKVILHNNQLEWRDTMPKNLSPQSSVEVYVTILENPSDDVDKTAVGEQMAQVLQSLAELPERSISDPVAWEREMREDRPLPLRA